MRRREHRRVFCTLPYELIYEKYRCNNFSYCKNLFY
ncbi:hypothetical protein THICB1_30353 [Thiomonas arsenitoxydans]|uniref:Uncharacterized protein n=1 Tax=Thiomonas arsenitoxydans (strain DSM 22701 / CIP 110005 / 3As) TaxID=426114 RepID=A0ABP1Z5L8_THIA3|nr:hypothetical protein THICB1_30353 [Thiomonas arsenitoxydans]CQR40482.1 hypothetical protein THICB6_80354 [Thiomonas arsenitoxydans]